MKEAIIFMSILFFALIKDSQAMTTEEFWVGVIGASTEEKITTSSLELVLVGKKYEANMKETAFVASDRIYAAGERKDDMVLYSFFAADQKMKEFTAKLMTKQQLSE